MYFYLFPFIRLEALVSKSRDERRSVENQLREKLDRKRKEKGESLWAQILSIKFEVCKEWFGETFLLLLILFSSSLSARILWISYAAANWNPWML